MSRRPHQKREAFTPKEEEVLRQVDAIISRKPENAVRLSHTQITDEIMAIRPVTKCSQERVGELVLLRLEKHLELPLDVPEEQQTDALNRVRRLLRPLVERIAKKCGGEQLRLFAVPEKMSEGIE